jgi:NAD(P)-dependent dehydrogenase (short-subunit alcohol dehydrogenase family)
MAEFRRMTEVTYYGQVHGTLAALDLMRPRDRGVIVNVGSAMAYRSIPLQAPYCGAKHAVKGFTESVMCELAHEKSKIKVCMVQLPGLNTTQFRWNLNKMRKHPMPVPPIFQPELPARAIAFLAEHPRRNMWVGVSTAYTILGERLAGSSRSRPVVTCPGSARTCSSRRTRRRMRARTAVSTTRRT